MGGPIAERLTTSGGLCVLPSAVGVDALLLLNTAFVFLRVYINFMSIKDQSPRNIIFKRGLVCTLGVCGFSLRAKFTDGDVREREATPEVSDFDEAGAVRRG